MRVREALEHGRGRLARAEIPSPAITAEVLLAHCLGKTREFLLAHPEYALEDAAAAAFVETIGRRIEREPLQYITGRQEFYGRPFAVDRSVLIPRPETELIVATALGRNRWGSPRILDVGTGSGCLAATLALEIPGARVFASDVSEAAVRTAQKNVGALEARVHLAVADLLEAWSGPFDMIVANPPYVDPAERDQLQAEVAAYEPAVSLFAAPDRISLYRRLIDGARRRLVPGGILILEIGFAMEPMVRALFGSRWARVASESDLQGISRVLTAEASPGSRASSDGNSSV